MISYLPPLFFFSFLWGGEGWGGLLPLAHLLYNSHLHGTWQPPVVFAGEEKNKTALVKIFLSQNCLSAKLLRGTSEWTLPRTLHRGEADLSDSDGRKRRRSRPGAARKKGPDE